MVDGAPVDDPVVHAGVLDAVADLERLPLVAGVITPTAPATHAAGDDGQASALVVRFAQGPEMTTAAIDTVRDGSRQIDVRPRAGRNEDILEDEMSSPGS